MLRLTQDLFSTLMEGLGPFEARPRFCVAVSGGADSLCLALLLHTWVQQNDGQLYAAIVDHQLREASTYEAEKTADLLRNQGIPATILSWEGPKPTTGLQRKAREARYRLLITWCHAQGLRYLFLGHHAEDQLETVLMREDRHSLPRGLAGMSASVEQGGIRLLRPLLPVPRAELQAVLRARHIPWIEDPANQNSRFTRIHMRSRLQAFSPQERQAYQDKIHAYGLLRQAEEQQAHQVLQQNLQFFPEGYGLLTLAPFKEAPFHIQKLALRKLLRRIRGREKFLKDRQIDAFLQMLCEAPVKQGRTLNGCFLKNNQGVLFMCREVGNVREEIPLTPQTPSTVLWDDRFLITLRVPPSRPLVLKALGEKGLALAKKQGLFLGRDSLPPRCVLLSLPGLWEEEVLQEIPSFALKEGTIPKSPALNIFFASPRYPGVLTEPNPAAFDDETRFPDVLHTGVWQK